MISELQERGNSQMKDTHEEREAQTDTTAQPIKSKKAWSPPQLRTEAVEDTAGAYINTGTDNGSYS